MRFVGFAVLIACTWWPALGAAQNAADIDKIADMMVRLCVGGGHTEATSAIGTGGPICRCVRSMSKGTFRGSSRSANRVQRVWPTASTMLSARSRQIRQTRCVCACNRFGSGYWTPCFRRGRGRRVRR